MFVSHRLECAFIAEIQRKHGTTTPPLSAASGADGLHGREVDALVQRLVSSVNAAGLGLTLASESPWTMLQVVSHLMLSCETLRAALAALMEHARLLLGGFDFELVEQDEGAEFRFAHPGDDPETVQFLADFVLVFALRVARVHALRPGSAPLAVRLAHPEPDHADAYRRIFGRCVWFDQPHYGLTFPHDLLDHRQPHADPALEVALRGAAAQQRRQQDLEASLLDATRHALREQPDLTHVDFERLARCLGTTLPALRKRLASTGSSCNELLNEARCLRALEELEDDERIDEIARGLGFSRRSAFHRAFKRWTGKTPNQFRARTPGRRTRSRPVPSDLGS
jgi:AraC-like DNA-binding protein